MKKTCADSVWIVAVGLCGAIVRGGLPPAWEGVEPARVQADGMTRAFVAPASIPWTSAGPGVTISNQAVLLKPGTRQPATVTRDLCVLRSGAGGAASLLFDFGRELQGGVQLVMGMTPGKNPVRFRVRFGESASEAMTDTGKGKTATNDHAMRDLEVMAPWLGSVTVGETGFRFVRIDLLDTDRPVYLKEIHAVFGYRDIPYLGSFRCSDERLDRIWMTGAYTVHLNMQHYLWDGIKRDRLVWIGDMHPEAMTICAVFGENDVVPRSLDYARDTFPLPGWMNGISSYSMWWVLIHREWYRHHGRLDYLKEQKAYLLPLLDRLAKKINDKNEEALDGRFLDWPSSENKPAIHAGLQALMRMTMEAGAELCDTLGEPAAAARCRETSVRLAKHIPPPGGSKQAAALLALSGLAPAAEMNEKVLAVDGAKRISTFYGYYVLQAMAAAGNHQGALDVIRTYWGAMLDLGATTFWEDFDLDWVPGAGRIDELTPAGKKDIHGDFGNYCYKGFRHSLCHGWASGPTAWLSEHVLGVRVLEPGCRRIRLEPHLGDLQWAEGTFPTPRGVLTVRHEKGADGKVNTRFTAPDGIEVTVAPAP